MGGEVTQFRQASRPPAAPVRGADNTAKEILFVIALFLKLKTNLSDKLAVNGPKNLRSEESECDVT